MMKNGGPPAHKQRSERERDKQGWGEIKRPTLVLMCNYECEERVLLSL